MRGNTIQIELPLKRGKVSKTIPLYQYDYGQNLVITGAELPEAYEVHFANEMHGDAVTSIGGSTGVAIPDSVLTSGDPIYLWLYLHEDSTDGETEFQGVIPVIKRASISDQTPTPAEQSAITEAIAALNSAVTQTTAAKNAAVAAQTHIENLSVSATTATPEAGASVTKTVNAQGEVNLAFAIPRGDKGDKGDQGIQGEPGTSGTNGTNGVSPVVSLTKADGVTTFSVTDAVDTYTVEINDGEPGDPTDLIDDTAGSGDTDVTWSANKLDNLTTTVGGKADLVSSPTEGNFAALTSGGNLTDSGHKHSDYLTSHQDITGKADKANPEFTGSISLGRKSGSTVGANSVAVGQGLVADSKNQAVFGQYNKVDEIPAWAANTHYYVGDIVYHMVMGRKLCQRCIEENTDSSYDQYKWENYGPQDINSKYAFAVGGGTAATQGEKNIFDICWNGDGEFAGDLTVNKGKENEVSVSSLKTEINSNTTAIGKITQPKLSRNIYNGEMWSVNGYFQDSGTFVEDNGYRTTAPVYLEAGNYMFNVRKASVGSSALKVFVVNSTGETVQSVVQGNDSGLMFNEETNIVTFTLANACYTRYNMASSRYASSFMIVKGSDASTYPTNYVPYVEGDLELKSTLGLTDQMVTEIEALKLKGKKLSVNGDSICYGEGYTGGYAKIIGDTYGMTVQNVAVSGGTITAETYSGSSARHWISRTITSMASDADFAIVEGGVNDAALTASISLGTLTNDFSSSLDDTTYLGALESTLKQLTTRFAGKKYGFIIVHKASTNFSNMGSDNSNWYWATRHALEKWGVPYLDLNVACPPFGLCSQQYSPELYALAQAYTKNGDGWHPNEDGYKKYYIPKIVSWMCSL